MSDAVVAPASRNSPCPCGSGLRYKECHGSLARSADANDVPAASLRSAYRAPGGEWAHLDEAARDQLGAKMVLALELQKAGRVDEAAREYRDVIAAAAGTHDALHMLGVIELGRGAVDEAERLISAALTLRPPYPAIEHNLLLIQDARTTLARAQPEELAERALPILVDLALGGGTAGRTTPLGDVHAKNSPPTAVHLIGRVHAGELDDGWLLRRLASLLDAKDTRAGRSTETDRKCLTRAVTGESTPEQARCHAAEPT